MKRTVSCLSAAVFVLMLFAAPAMACHGTIGKQYKDERQVDYWEYCAYYGPASGIPSPVGPAVHFQRPVLIHYVGEQDFTATDRLVKGVHKVTWKRNVEGTATVYSVPTGGGPEMLMMSVAPLLTVTPEGSTEPIDILPGICSPAYPAEPDVAKVILAPDTYKLYTAPFVVNEVVKDVGNDSGCFNANSPAPVNFLDCVYGYGYGPWNAVDYMSYSAKIKGPMGYRWTMTIRQAGTMCFDDKYVDAVCYNWIPWPY